MKDLYETILRGRVDFQSKTGRRPTELYLGQESYRRLVNEMRDMAGGRFQHEMTGLEKYDGMNIRVVMFEHDHIGFGV